MENSLITVTPAVEPKQLVSTMNAKGVFNGFRAMRPKEFKATLPADLTPKQKSAAFNEYNKLVCRALNAVVGELQRKPDAFINGVKFSQKGFSISGLYKTPTISDGTRKKGAVTEEEAAAVMANATKIPVADCLRIIRENAKAFKPIDVSAEITGIADEVKGEPVTV